MTMTVRDNSEYWNLNRVYVRFDESMCGQLQKMNVNKLLDEFAKTIQEDEYGKKLIMCGHVCRGRTVSFILREANRVVDSLARYGSTENMKLYVSRRQVTKLVKTMKNGNRCCITGYALILFRVMLDHMLRCNASNASMRKLEVLFSEIGRAVDCYHRHHGNDRISFFLLQCLEPLKTEYANRRIDEEIDEYPAIPRNDPHA